MSWIELFELWIRDTRGALTGRRHQEKAKMVLDIIFGAEDLFQLFLITESFAESVTKCAAKIIQSELDDLSRESKLFGTFDHSVPPHDFDFSRAVEHVERYSPNFR